ncbi:MAG: hypothetical protein U9R79_06180 [Armatimonadota bacterium]|nr:hypothetical protein [Armatimonadota bacterium]
MARPLLIPRNVRPLLETLVKAAKQFSLFEESEHPRYPKGHPQAGQFMPKGGGGGGGKGKAKAKKEEPERPQPLPDGCDLVETDRGKLAAYTPYNQDFIAAAKKLGGGWNKRLKCWEFAKEKHADVRELIIRTYGEEPPPAEPGPEPPPLEDVPELRGDVRVKRVEMKQGPKKVKVVAPYNDEFIAAARDLGGKWSKQNKAWYFGLDKESNVYELCLDAYGPPLPTEEPPPLEDKPDLPPEVQVERVKTKETLSGTHGLEDRWRVEVRSPYKDSFVRGARKLDGRWDKYGKKWIFDIRKESQVYELCKKAYGTRKPEKAEVPSGAKRMQARHRGVCAQCGGTIEPGDEIYWFGRKKHAIHAECPASPEPAPSNLEHGGGTDFRYVGAAADMYREGEVLRPDSDTPRIVTEVVPDDWRENGGYWSRPATPSEVKDYKADQARRRAKAEAAAKLDAERKDLQGHIKEQGERPDPADGMKKPAGERYDDTQNIYGGGDWFVVGPKYIWYVQNNGADGDNWGYNNVATVGAGAIGWRVPYDEEIAERIRKLDESQVKKSSGRALLSFGSRNALGVRDGVA